MLSTSMRTLERSLVISFQGKITATGRCVTEQYTMYHDAEDKYICFPTLMLPPNED
jgi:hypothetical protein